MQLREYQQKAIEALYRYLRERDGNPAIVAPTGSGKSLLIAAMARDVVSEGGRVLILAHVKELLEQNADKVKRLCPEIDMGIYSAGLRSRNTENRIIVAGIQSVRKRAGELGAFDLCVIDEAHRISPDEGTSYRKFLSDAKLVNPHMRVVGLTATPYRLDCGPICQPDGILHEIAHEIPINELIRDGYLCRISTKEGEYQFDTNQVKIRGGEFAAEDVDNFVNTDEAVESVISEIIARDRKSVLIFCNSVAHAEHTVEYFAEREIECGIVVGDTPDKDRTKTLERFNDGSLRYLANVGVLTTGYDCPRIDMVVLWRCTMSPGLYVQMVGRGLRLHESKTNCLILDYGGNVKRHGPIDDVRVKVKDEDGEGAAPVKTCPECGELCHAAVRECPECRYQFPPPVKASTVVASKAAILKAEKEIVYHELDVLDTRYSEHRKRGSAEGDPRTLRVDYKVGKLGQIRSEWVCLEHDGFARGKAERWWKMRSDDPCPRTVERALEVIDSGGLAVTTKIQVKEIEGEKFPEITAYLIGDKPPAVPAEDYETVLALANRRRGERLPGGSDPFGAVEDGECGLPEGWENNPHFASHAGSVPVKDVHEEPVPW